ncbi:MAG TPA: hypothetical protein PLQ97_14485 [Myxococcota bacterium]|nr:hypothetical protein [Myxococcota bacterium]HQK49899.1 hypothetical protein [Myxococcota bacterium]
MSQVLMDAHGRRADTLAKAVNRYADDGRDVILRFRDGVAPERVLKIIGATVGDYDVKIVVRHAALQEYLVNAGTGAAVGAGVGAGAAVATAILAGNPVTLGPVLVAAGLGAIVGALVGAAATPIAQIVVYKYRGETRVKFLAA